MGGATDQPTRPVVSRGAGWRWPWGQQVRWWATLRGQTLGRTVMGLMEMREAVVDLAFLELKAIHVHSFPDIDYHNPDPRSTYDDILAPGPPVCSVSEDDGTI